MLATISLFFFVHSVWAAPPNHGNELTCGHARYSPSAYTCYEGDVLCPIYNGKPTLRCGPHCFRPGEYECVNGQLTPPGNKFASSPGPTCSSAANTLHLSDPPYENHFYSDCNVDTQVVVTSPLPESNLSMIGPRLIVAWPGGNSGACGVFLPKDGVNGSLSLELVPSSTGQNLTPAYVPNKSRQFPSVGVEGTIRFNASAVLALSILGSIRAIRLFTEGPSLLLPELQDAMVLNSEANGGASLSRLWLDNVTTTTFSFYPHGNTSSVDIEEGKISFSSGEYTFSALVNYPQPQQLPRKDLFAPGFQTSDSKISDQVTSLAFLSYRDKLLAGAWRFLTYFGRDSMISALLLQPALGSGKGSAMEAVITAALERINRTDGSGCHEETVGDYATYLNLQKNISSTAPEFDYNMIDTDFFIPILLQHYFLGVGTGILPGVELMNLQAGTTEPRNAGLSYRDLARINAEQVMRLAAPFAQAGGATIENLIHLKDGTWVGQWRDSILGVGGGRIPYDVNTALVPAALRAIGALARFDPSIYEGHGDWAVLADVYAQVWETESLPFFEVSMSVEEAQKRVNAFAESSDFYHGPSHADTIESNVTFYGLALDGNNEIPNVDVMNTDDCFRLFLLNSTSDQQLTSFLNQSALNILRPFPAGLSTSVGVVVANPALADEDVLRANFTNSAYHGTVVWGWQLSMLARGLELQLDRCNNESELGFCSDDAVYSNVRRAYNSLWDNLEKNQRLLTQEVWSWVYQDDDFQFTPLGSLPPPPGVDGGTESNIVQLWSLTFLAVRRNEAFR